MAAGPQSLYRCAGTARTGSTGLVWPAEAATATAGMPPHHSSSLPQMDSPSGSGSPAYPALAGSRYNSHAATGGTAQAARLAGP